MKRQPKRRGGGSRPAEQVITEPLGHAEKNFRQKRARELAFEDRSDEECCWDLAGTFACESAKRTDEPIGAIRDRYEEIVIELLAARYTQVDRKRYSLCNVLHSAYETDTALNEFLPEFRKWIGKYVSDCIREHTFEFTPVYRQLVPAHYWMLYGHSVTRGVLSPLAEEYVRDVDGLMRFLSAVFKRWQKLHAPYSPWRFRLLAQQFTGTSNEVAAAMVKVDAAPRKSRSLGDRVRQYRSRDQREALKRRGL
jgi:hypothetical protein